MSLQGRVAAGIAADCEPGSEEHRFFKRAAERDISQPERAEVREAVWWMHLDSQTRELHEFSVYASPYSV